MRSVLLGMLLLPMTSVQSATAVTSHSDAEPYRLVAGSTDFSRDDEYVLTGISTDRDAPLPVGETGQDLEEDNTRQIPLPSSLLMLGSGLLLTLIRYCRQTGA